MSEAQNIDNPTTDDSNKNTKSAPKSNVVDTITTDGVGSISLNQEQTEVSAGDLKQEQNAFLKIILQNNDKVHAVMHLKQK